jgi:hypothetical protein
VGTWHDPDLGRPIAAPLERCAELLGIDLSTVRELAAKLEPYVRADGTRIWSLTQLERQLRPGVRPAPWRLRRPPSDLGPDAQLGSGVSRCLLVMSQWSAIPRGAQRPEMADVLGPWSIPTGSRPALFLSVSTSLVSKQ